MSLHTANLESVFTGATLGRGDPRRSFGDYMDIWCSHQMAWQITTGQIGVGETLEKTVATNEIELGAIDFNEVCRILESDNFLRERRVLPVRRDCFDEHFICAEALCRLVARSACGGPRAEHNVIDGFARLCDNLEDAASSRDLYQFVEAEAHLHRLVSELTRNDHLISLLNGLERARLRYHFFTFERHPQVMSAVAERSRKLLEAFMVSDTRKAAAQLVAINRAIWQAGRQSLAVLPDEHRFTSNRPE